MTQVALTSGQEWRFQVDSKSELVVKPLNGITEINGTELANNREYHFKNINSSVYCYEDATLQITGNCTQNITNKSNVPRYLALHFALQNARNKNKQPKLMVVGPVDSGKSFLCRTLVSYAVKMEETPMLVNLNPQEGVYSVPGTLTAAVVNDIFDVEQGYGTSVVTGASAFHPVQPAVMFYGFSSADVNPSCYLRSVEMLGSAVESRLQKDAKSKKSGTIIDTVGWKKEDDIDQYDDIIKSFKVDTIVVLESKELEEMIRKRYESLNVVYFDKDDGCVAKDSTFMRSLQQTQIKNYFYGERKTVLSPFTLTAVDYSRISVFRVVELNKVEKREEENRATVDVSSVLPIGEGEEEWERELMSSVGVMGGEDVEMEEKTEGVSVKNEGEVKEEKEEEKGVTVKEEKEKEEETIVKIEDGENREEKEESKEKEDGEIIVDKTTEVKKESEDSGGSQSLDTDEKKTVKKVLIKEGPMVEKIEPQSSFLQNSLIAFVQAPKDATAEEVVTSVYCFGHISDANDTKKKLRILLPVQGGVPKMAMVLGEFRFLD